MRSAPVIIVIALLLLPMLYVASYFALVLPDGPWDGHYRIASRDCARLYWPLERLDRQVRPGEWHDWRHMVE